MTLESRFQAVDSAIDPLFFIRYLDKLSSNREIVRCRKIGFDFIARGQIKEVLEIGCGVGDVCAALARLFPQSRVLGLDKSRTMLDESGRRHGVLPNLEFREGSFTELHGLTPDAIWIERVLTHCNDPENAVRAAVKSLEPKGRLVVIEPDWGTLVLTGVDPSLASVWTTDIANVQLSGTIGRQLPLLFKNGSIALERHEIAFLPFQSKTDLNDLIDLERTISSAVKRTVLSPSDGLALMTQLSHADQTRNLCGFVALVVAMGSKDC